MHKWLPLVWANLSRKPLRSILTIVSIVASFALFGVLESFRYAVSEHGNDYADALIIQSRNVPLPHAHVGKLRAMDGIRSACGFLLVYVVGTGEKRQMVQGVDDQELFDVHPGISLDEQAKERWRRERIAAIVDQSTATEYAWTEGDRVMLRGTGRGAPFRRRDGVDALEVVIGGVYTVTNPLASSGIFVHYDYVRDLIGPDAAGLEYIAARMTKGADIDLVRDRIDVAFRHSAAATKTYSYRALLRAAYSTFSDIARAALAVMAVSFITFLLIAGSVLVQAQRERIRELAVLRGLGTPSARLLLLLGTEALVLIAPAAVIGIGIANVVARHVEAGVALTIDGLLPGHTIGAAAALILASTMIVSIVPCLELIRLPVAATLRRV